MKNKCQSVVNAAMQPESLVALEVSLKPKPQEQTVKKGVDLLAAKGGVEKLNPWYITGIVDGEGSFTIKVSSPKSISPIFRIGLRADDEQIIKRIREYFGVGSLYLDKRLGQKRDFNSNPVWHYVVTSFKKCLVVVKHFDAYPLQAKKNRDYQIWRKLVLSRKNLTSQEKLSLAGEIRKIRKYEVDNDRLFERARNIHLTRSREIAQENKSREERNNIAIEKVRSEYNKIVRTIGRTPTVRELSTSMGVKYDYNFFNVLQKIKHGLKFKHGNIGRR